MTLEPVTAVICTRNRGAAALRAAESVLANDHPALKLIVVDQSTNQQSHDALSSLFDDPRFRYVRSATVGVSRSRNTGLRAAETNVVVFTDDDCDVPRDWARTMQSVLHEHPRVAMLFCDVRPGPHDPALGFVPAYACGGTRVVRSLLDKCTARGMGAGLAVRKNELLAIGGFDEQLGPGGLFPSCEEGDAAARALLAGMEVCETNRTFVVHHGFRSWAEGKLLSRRDWVGIGAAYVKPLRAGRWRFAPIVAYELFVKALWPPVNDLIHLRMPRGVLRGAYFLSGFARGIATPLNRELLVYQTDRAPMRASR